MVRVVDRRTRRPGRIACAPAAQHLLDDSPIEPRCTGMCGALAIRLPSGSNSAQEKSSRSLMLTDCAVFSRRTPICSAIDMKRLLKTSSSTGSASVPTPASAGARRPASSSRCPSSVMAACQPASTTVVASASAMIAGPVTVSPGGSSLAPVQRVRRASRRPCTSARSPGYRAPSPRPCAEGGEVGRLGAARSPPPRPPRRRAAGPW